MVELIELSDAIKSRAWLNCNYDKFAITVPSHIHKLFRVLNDGAICSVAFNFIIVDFRTV